jgi:Glycolipid transfer protein (GLTP)
MQAYNKNLASMHSYMVRTAIKASMYLLPNRDDFMKSIGETGEYAYAAVQGLYWGRWSWCAVRNAL